MMNGSRADLRRRRAHGLDVRGAFDERLAHRVHARAERELQARAIVLGERADAEIDARQVQSLARTQLAADGDRAFHVVAGDALDDELDEAVVEKEPVARLHDARQRLEAHRDALRVADDVFIREREAVARHELNRLRLDLPEAHLRPRQIGHDRHAPARRLRGRRGCAAMTSAWSEKSPCEKLSRAMFSPARMSRSSISGDSDAGPMVATILVLWLGNNIVMNLGALDRESDDRHSTSVAAARVVPCGRS